jgi:glycosyltransferase involved in cell wall biosynthesis
VKIFGWAADNAGPGWYRLRVPLDELAKHGHQVEISTVMPEWALDEADVIIGQRTCQPGATERWRQLAAGVYGHRPLLVFELDDDLWDLDPANRPAWSFYRRTPGLLDNLAECAKLADVCTVSTEPLADVVREYNRNVVVLPNQLPAVAYSKPKSCNPAHMFIGWAGGASHELDVKEMTDGLRQHFRRRADTFVNLGSLFESVARAVGKRLVSVAWTPDMHEHYDRLTSLDIGLAPLRPSPFNQSKSEIKFLEYAAAGAACIATKHGPYERVIEHQTTGLLVSRPHEWTQALRQLTEHPEDRDAMAADAYDYAWTRSIMQHWPIWEQVYTG